MNEQEMESGIELQDVIDKTQVESTVQDATLEQTPSFCLDAPTCSSSAVQVAVRIRPLTANELLEDATECVSPATTDPCSVMIGSHVMMYGQPAPQKAFTFDHVLTTSSTQEQVYQQCVYPLMLKFLQGYNATIFAYGQTGSGKTYSMGTGMEVGVTEQERGIVPRVIESMFDHLEQLKMKNPLGFKYKMFVSFLELYNEDLVDLLNPRPKTANNGWGGLSIREDGQGNIVWSGVREEPVYNQQDVMSCLHKGSLCRTTGSTDMNACSSRSHAIFSIIIQKETWISSSCTDASTVCNPETHSEGSWQAISSKFHFVDLAGSERLKRTNAHGDRKKEGISINQGLLSLGNVISALGDEARKASHVPYRDSKLTRLLQDSLGGNSQTLMLACISPSHTNYAETLNTLQYANRAKNIKNKVSLNYHMVGGPAAEREMNHLRQLVTSLQNEVASLRSQDVSFAGLDRHRYTDYEHQVSLLKRQAHSKTFEIEKLSFFNMRLQSRCKELLKELAEVTGQRNASMLEMCSLKKKVLSKEACIDTNEEVASTSHMVLLGQQKMITDLRLKLSDTQDKLAWYKNVFGKLGKKDAKSHSAPSSRPCSPFPGDVAEEMDMKPKNPRLNSLLDGNELELLHERNFIKVLKSDPELQKVLQTFDAKQTIMEPDASLPKFYGIPNKVSTPFQPSPLTLYPPVGADNVETSAQETLESSEEVMEDDGDEEYEDEEKAHSRSSSIYLLVDKIQSDIAEHETIVNRLQKSEAEYEAMKQAFEQKLHVLQNQMSQIKKERDLAMDKVQQGSGPPKEKAGTLAIKTRYDKQQKKLESEIMDLRRKLNMRTSSKSQNEVLIKTLKTTIQSLKAEKTSMTRRLKMEAEKSRWYAVSKEKEVNLLKKKERQIVEAVKKLESSHMHKLLKRRSSEFGMSNDKLKSVLSILKKTTHSSRRVYRPSNRPLSALEKTRSIQSMVQRPMTAPPLHPLEDDESVPPVQVRAQFKKQMLEKELDGCIAQRRLDFTLDELLLSQARLLGEEKELLHERSKWVEMDQQQGIQVENKRYYMDDRLDKVKEELALIATRIQQAQPGSDAIFGHTTVTQEHDNWENAVNLLKSLDPAELQIVAQLYMTETVKLRVQALDHAPTVSKDIEKVLEWLKSPLFKTVLNEKLQIMSSLEQSEWTGLLSRLGIQVEKNERLDGVKTKLEPVVEVNEEEEEVEPCSPETKSSDPAAVAAAAIKQALEAAKEEPSHEIPPRQVRPQNSRDFPTTKSIGEMRESIQRARHVSLSFKGLDIVDSADKKEKILLHRSKSSHSLGESVKKNETASERLLRLLEHRSPNMQVAPAAEQDTLSAKEYKDELHRLDWMDVAGQTGGTLTDVFERLAHKHTASSQAKVIQRREETENSV